MDKAKDSADRDQSDSKLDGLELDFDLLPEWARQPPGRNDNVSPDRPSGRDKRGQGKPERSEKSRGRHSERHRKRPVPALVRNSLTKGQNEYLPMDVSLIPEQEHLSRLIADIRASKKAYPLKDLALLFLSHPDNYMVKFMSRESGASLKEMTFYQDSGSGLLFLDKDRCISRIASRLIDTEFEKETLKVEPPSGNFVCVSRCRLSGVLLGPPNFHEYRERLEKHRRSRFPHLSPDEYRRKIESVRDPEYIEQWKSEWSTRTVYHPKSGATDSPMTYSEALDHVRTNLSSRFLVKGHRFIIPAELSGRLEDKDLHSAFERALKREGHMPVTLMRALRVAFRRLRLHVFKAGNGNLFVTSIPPNPIDGRRTVKVVADILDFITAHHDCSRHDLIKGLDSQSGVDFPGVQDVVKNLQWLIERGHIVEFHDGSLATPGGSIRRQESEVRRQAQS